MNPVLVLIDVQRDFSEDARLVPPATTVLPRICELLDEFRTRSFPVVHVHYITEPDGRGHLPHHKRKGQPRCLRGTSSAEPDQLAAPVEGEPVFTKHAYSAFGCESFRDYLAERESETLVLCGLYAHACVRQTAIDAFLRGFRVMIVEDAVASTDPLHAEVTRSYLAERGVVYVSSSNLFGELNVTAFGKDVNSSDGGVVVESSPAEVNVAVRAAADAQREWASRPIVERLAVVEKWGRILLERPHRFYPLMIAEVAKPVRACQVEFQLLENSLRVLKEVIEEDCPERLCRQEIGQVAIARRRPLGVVGVISPWNNPIYLPACKIAAATALGNGVVWKPADPCPRTSKALQETIAEAGFPEGLVNLVHGGKSTAQILVAHPGISALTLTGSISTGRQVAATCGALLKPLQAELGGNNAAVVLEPCNLKVVAEQIALSAFGYAGQACTATRRVIVAARIKEAFVEQLTAAAGNLKVGHPQDEGTVVGPVISRSHKVRIERMIAAVHDKARVHEIPLPDDLPGIGNWMPMRIIEGLKPGNPLVQEESFAPVLVVQVADDIDHAIRLCNHVSQGLIASIFCDDSATVDTFADHVHSGVVQLNLPSRNLHMESPFGGWKDSGLGPPEHGIWDLDFYTRWQAVNRKLPG